jgi:putative ABC transport system substrate-binding protein
MKRRTVLRATAAAAAPWRIVRAQQPAKPKLVAVLGVSNPQTAAAFLEGFKAALRDLGWVEGRNIVFEFRWADGRFERLPGLARELVALAPDLIYTVYTPAALAALQATATIPIVVQSAADPVGSGLAQSLARPGGNVTGLSMLNADLGPKQLELLKVASPGLARVAVLSNPADPTTAVLLKNLPTTAEMLHVSLVHAEARSPEDIEPAIARALRHGVDALIIPGGSLFLTNDALIVPLLSRHRLLSSGTSASALNYGPDPEESRRRAASQVDRILKGAKPAEMPIEQASRLRLVINQKAAKALGLTIPQSLLLRADEVIE